MEEASELQELGLGGDAGSAEGSRGVHSCTFWLALTPAQP